MIKSDYLLTRRQSVVIGVLQSAIGWRWLFVLGVSFFIPFCAKSFFYELSTVPSSSMAPSIFPNDKIVIKKNSFGYRVPILDVTLGEKKRARRGEVVVFSFPLNQNYQYVKRVVGVAGDRVEYINGQLFINSELIQNQRQPIDVQSFLLDSQSKIYSEKVYKSNLDYNIIRLPAGEFTSDFRFSRFHKADENCVYSKQGVSCIVPNNSYFVLGDNRDNSIDSRYWGFVTQEQLLGSVDYIFEAPFSLKKII